MEMPAVLFLHATHIFRSAFLYGSGISINIYLFKYSVEFIRNSNKECNQITLKILRL